MTQLNLKEYGIEKVKDGEYESKKFAANLNAEDLGRFGESTSAIIQKVQEKEFDAAEGKKVILTLDVPVFGDDAEKRTKQLSLNKTNLVSVLEGLGDDTEKWINQIIVLKVEKTKYKGQTVKCIRVDAKK